MARRKRFRASKLKNPVLNGPAKLAEAFAILPQVKRALPEAELPMQHPRVAAAMLGSTVALQAAKRSGLRPVARELLTAVLSVAPAAFALTGGELAAYHGAEHIAIGTYEHGTARPKEHERCGSHLVAPIVLTTAAGNAAVAQLPPELRGPGRVAATIGSLAAATELFGWMTRHPKHPAAQMLSKPGHELQHRISTAEPTEAQLEVAEAALAACLALEQHGDHQG